MEDMNIRMECDGDVTLSNVKPPHQICLQPISKGSSIPTLFCSFISIILNYLCLVCVSMNFKTEQCAPTIANIFESHTLNIYLLLNNTYVSKK